VPRTTRMAKKCQADKSPKTQAANAAYEALRTSTTTQAWEACVPYDQSQVWPTSNQADE